MKKGYLWLSLVLFIAFSAQNTNAVMMGFEDLALGTSYDEPNSFYASGIEILVGQFYPYGGGDPISGGEVSVGNGGLAGWFGNELELNNVNLHFLLGDACPSCGYVSLLFGYEDGDFNIGINGGEPEKFQSIFDITAGTIIGGASVKVVGGGAFGAMMIVNGDIDIFSIGGEALVIDAVFACEGIPEPTTIALLGLGGVSLLAKRKKS